MSTSNTVSPLRQRMIEDMTARNLGHHSQRSHVYNPNEYVNKEIYNRAGQLLGTIKDVLVGPDGKMAALTINVGQYLGIGDKELAVPFFAVQRDSAQRIVIDATKDALQTAPDFVRHKSSKQ
jgi:sporulation protein YlmC with PRC-barrel domain